MTDENKIAMAVVISIAVFACTLVVRISSCVENAPASVTEPERVTEMKACRSLCEPRGAAYSAPEYSKPMRCVCGESDGGVP